eukprot:265768_1
MQHMTQNSTAGSRSPRNAVSLQSSSYNNNMSFSQNGAAALQRSLLETSQKIRNYSLSQKFTQVGSHHQTTTHNQSSRLSQHPTPQFVHNLAHQNHLTSSQYASQARNSQLPIHLPTESRVPRQSQAPTVPQIHTSHRSYNTQTASQFLTTSQTQTASHLPTEFQAQTAPQRSYQIPTPSQFLTAPHNMSIPSQIQRISQASVASQTQTTSHIPITFQAQTVPQRPYQIPTQSQFLTAPHNMSIPSQNQRIAQASVASQTQTAPQIATLTQAQIASQRTHQTTASHNIPITAQTQTAAHISTAPQTSTSSQIQSSSQTQAASQHQRPRVHFQLPASHRSSQQMAQNSNNSQASSSRRDANNSPTQSHNSQLDILYEADRFPKFTPILPQQPKLTTAQVQDYLHENELLLTAILELSSNGVEDQALAYIRRLQENLTYLGTVADISHSDAKSAELWGADQ